MENCEVGNNHFAVGGQKKVVWTPHPFRAGSWANTLAGGYKISNTHIQKGKTIVAIDFLADSGGFKVS